MFQDKGSYSSYSLLASLGAHAIAALTGTDSQGKNPDWMLTYPKGIKCSAPSPPPFLGVRESLEDPKYFQHSHTKVKKVKYEAHTDLI